MGGLSTCPVLKATELQELLTYVPYLYTQWKLKGWPGFSTEIVQSWDCKLVPHSSRLARSFQNAQRNLKIAQIPSLRLHGTHTFTRMVLVQQLMYCLSYYVSTGYPPQAGYPPPQAGYPPPQAGYPPPSQPQQVVVVTEPQTQQTTVVYKKDDRPNHLLHAIITFFCPCWIFVWCILCCVYGC